MNMGNEKIQEAHLLGLVVGGSLTEGVKVRLDSAVSVENIKVGEYAIIQGERLRFFGVITDVSLEYSDPHLAINPPDVSNPMLAEVVSGTAAFGSMRVLPMLAIGDDPLAELDGPQAAKTIPTHFSRVTTASERDIAMVFGNEDERHFWIGSPLDMEARVCLDLEEFTKRSNGVFGKSGTGKTFLTRILLIGMLQKSSAVNLVFDMESEYGWMGTSENGRNVKGLKQLFPSRVAVFTLDEESSRRRGLSPDFVVRIGYGDIEPADIEMLGQTLNLTPNAAQATYSLRRHLGKYWLQKFMALSAKDGLSGLVQELGQHEGTIEALHRRLERLLRMSFLSPDDVEDSVARILEHLQNGMHVVLEFGRHGRDLAAYILVANLLTRRLHERYVQRTEEAMGDHSREPHPLVITIEEAHRFLNPTVASQTIFGTIAREMRKYKVTLLVVDQRPSAIDEEVMSQLGTKVVCLLDNERDVDAALTGMPNARSWKTVLSTLRSKQQALIFGHALPMPVPVRTRDYGSEDSYKELGVLEATELKRSEGALWGKS
jgi:DNA helicase HerA-like ATPase